MSQRDMPSSPYQRCTIFYCFIPTYSLGCSHVEDHWQVGKRESWPFGTWYARVQSPYQLHACAFWCDQALDIFLTCRRSGMICATTITKLKRMLLESGKSPSRLLQGSLFDLLVRDLPSPVYCQERFHVLFLCFWYFRGKSNELKPGPFRICKWKDLNYVVHSYTIFVCCVCILTWLSGGIVCSDLCRQGIAGWGVNRY